MYVYIRSEPNLWTVGFYNPDDGKWNPESDHPSSEQAAQRIHWLNGGNSEAENLLCDLVGEWPEHCASNAFEAAKAHLAMLGY